MTNNEKKAIEGLAINQAKSQIKKKVKEITDLTGLLRLMSVSEQEIAHATEPIRANLKALKNKVEGR